MTSSGLFILCLNNSLRIRASIVALNKALISGSCRVDTAEGQVQMCLCGWVYLKAS